MEGGKTVKSECLSLDDMINGHFIMLSGTVLTKMKKRILFYSFLAIFVSIFSYFALSKVSDTVITQISIKSTRQNVFSFLSNLENLPKISLAA